MMGSNRRNRDLPQVEICDLCGAYRAASELVETTVEGLSGLRVCMDHGDFIRNPSFNDLGGVSQAENQRPDLEPHSGTNWAISDWD